MAEKKIDSETLRRIPKVDEILQHSAYEEISRGIPRWICLDAVRGELESVRGRILAGVDPGQTEELLDLAGIISRTAGRIAGLRLFRLRKMINATGIIIHTNLGRALLPGEAVDRMLEVAVNYTNLEFDLDSGKRGSRHDHLRSLLTRLTGAEDGLVVNNNAAAVLLTLNTLARGREVIVSRGELVEIGGSFRIPDVMARSGATLKEVGATNKTHLGDYESAIGPQTALLLKVHTSNYRIIGFSHQPSLSELSALGKKHGLPVVEDLGSGCLADLSEYGLDKEPLVGRSIEDGADIVTFSGDKLLGGPQAGIIIGRKDLIGLIDRNPLHRALRIDKFTASALEATLRLYLEGERALTRIPVLSMISLGREELQVRGRRLLEEMSGSLPGHLTISLEDTNSQVGGGALPLQEIPSVALALSSELMKVNQIEERFRKGEPPIIGRIYEERYLLDLRTVAEDDYPLIARAVEGLEP